MSCKNNNQASLDVQQVAVDNVAPQNSGVIQVFKASGDKQCQSSNIALDIMSNELITAGIDVLCSKKIRDTSNVLNSCGSPTGELNLFEINNANLTDALLIGFKKAVNFNNVLIALEKCQSEIIPQAVEYQKVYKRDIVAQCQGSVTTPEVMAQALMAQDIIVRCAQKNTDGLVHVAVCGGLSGNINVFKIKKSDVTKALLGGFKPVSELTNYTDIACKPTLEKVYKDYQYSQCSGSPITAQDMAQELIDLGIAVNCSQRGSTGTLSAAVCGGIASGRHIFEINSNDVAQALLNGFRAVTELANYSDVVCQAN